MEFKTSYYILIKKFIAIAERAPKNFAKKAAAPEDLSDTTAYPFILPLHFLRDFLVYLHQAPLLR